MRAPRAQPRCGMSRDVENTHSASHPVVKTFRSRGVNRAAGCCGMFFDPSRGAKNERRKKSVPPLFPPHTGGGAPERVVGQPDIRRRHGPARPLGIPWPSVLEAEAGPPPGLVHDDQEVVEAAVYGTVKAQLHRARELMYELVKGKKEHI